MIFLHGNHFFFLKFKGKRHEQKAQDQVIACAE